MKKRTNAGYEIKSSITVNNIEIVFGENPKAVTPYVIWRCENGNYYWGHYYTSERDALLFFANEIIYELDDNKETPW